MRDAGALVAAAGHDLTALAYLDAEERGAGLIGAKPSYDVERAALQLTGFNPITFAPEPGWGGIAGRAFTVTYAYRATEPARMPSDVSGFQTFNSAQIAQTELALASWSDVAAIRFVRVSGFGLGGGYSDNAAILFANYSRGETGSAAFANFPGSTAASSSAGDVWVNVNSGTNGAPAMGNYGAHVLVHEIGHAIGLTHPGDYNASGDSGAFTYAQDAEYYEDSRQYTVMSYFGEAATGARFAGRYPSAPQLDDIRAAQLEYGPNPQTRTGDTVYGFNATADRPWYRIASPSEPAIFTVWDAGGQDLFDFSGYSQDQNIDLQEGHFSDVGGLVGNVAIALGVSVESAWGGSGRDTLTGSSVDNELRGGAGADCISGLAGDDRLLGGGGNDRLDGGDGADVAIYAGHSASYAWTALANGWSITDSSGADGSDLLLNVEKLRFADREVRIFTDLPDAYDPIFANILRTSTTASAAQGAVAQIADLLDQNASSERIIGAMVDLAAGTTSVATLTYQFFTGRVPTSSGLDYLVAPAGPNPNNLNAAYYQTFSLENRYINFAVNLGTAGEGQSAFSAAYGHLSLAAATSRAYEAIFGGAPSAAKVQTLLSTTFELGGQTLSRADYFAYYGRDGHEGIGTKAAMVGFLLAEAAKAELGSYARANELLLTDLADGAALGVDLLAAYGRPEFAFFPT